MAPREPESTRRTARPPRAMAWVLLLASAAAVAATGLLATLLLFGNAGGVSTPPARYWPRFVLACALTVTSLGLRSLRWIFLLRRAGTRMPIRDAYIGYLAGFSLLFTPLFIGEAAVRAAINRRRSGVPILSSVIVNAWERLVDVVALLAIAGAGAWALGIERRVVLIAAGVVALTALRPVRAGVLTLAVALLEPVSRRFDPRPAHDFRRLARDGAWWTALATSVAAWVLPGLGLWLLAGTWPALVSLSAAEAQWEYAQAATRGGALLAPGGILVAGRVLYDALAFRGLNDPSTLLVVAGVRLATVGVSTVLGFVFVAIHLRTAPAPTDTHFDDIADAYDVQIPESRRQALLALKTSLMKDVLDARGIGRRGLDVGCGQGAYVAEMRRMGFDVRGIDASAGQILLAGRNVGSPDLVRVGSVLAIPAADASYDFLYIINVLHHLGSIDEQRRAFAELFRVLKPGGLLFVHEINTRNVLFRFYMGYVFPSLNCIDEGVERWLLPHRLDAYTRARVADVRYFTFLPDFIPQAVAWLLRPIERWLERSPLGVYSAHYMAVLVNAEDQR